MKIKEILKNGIDKLREYSIQDAILKAQILMECQLNMSHEKMIVNYEKEMETNAINEFFENIDQLIKGKPIQYITNSQNFFGLGFYVDENVLVPQPDTEILVEEVIKLRNEMSQKPRILDICTGSGAIAIALDKNIEAEIFASDISNNALQVARKNALKLQAKIKFLKSDMFENIKGKFDVIVSNPPYIEVETIKNLSIEVKSEPVIALDGGKDGLKFYRVLAKKSKEHLKNNGFLAVEIGYQQKEKVMEIFEREGFCEIYSKKDFGGNNRIVVGKWR